MYVICVYACSVRMYACTHGAIMSPWFGKGRKLQGICKTMGSIFCRAPPLLDEPLLPHYFLSCPESGVHAVNETFLHATSCAAHHQIIL